MLVQLILACLVVYIQVWDSLSLGMKQNSWNYNFISITANSSDEELFSWDVHLERMGRSEFGVSGTLVVSTDLDDAFVEILIYRSATGSNNYKREVYGVDKQPLEEFMNTAYKNLYMSSFVGCSNMPQLNENGKVKLEKDVYHLNKCQFSTETSPSFVLPGYYKLIIVLSGVVDSVLVALVQIESTY